ncbi:MAG: hypothetical protein BM557_07320 [Flavobacterium sp. MedPE-SWcel]|uniref:NAD(P)H-dependent oxidoreductase n=1 Tax=uncultured Flavobacterium sp. TaxID=165435 RepID=UPI0009247375|nr:NAD(P)H-dependent oxidoreductase [uncultured Flavobacterium sp.]OIQ18021.1 MAG: hypothetical protein BM557_07320 [Flavobacterium sp. MedPE-SWcel]
MKNIIAFTGSNNPNSINKKLVKYIINKFPDKNIEFLDLTLYNVPIYSQAIEKEGIPEPIKKLFKLFTETEAFIIASPEHNGLPTAFLKNILDWLSRIDQKFLGEKPVLLLSTSPGAVGGKTHLQTLSKLVKLWGGLLVGQYSLGSFNQKFNIDTSLIIDFEENRKLEKVVNALFRGESIITKNNITVVKDYFSAFQSGDMDAVLNSFHTDCYIVSVKEEERPKEQLHGIYRSKSEAKQLLINITTLFNTKDFTVNNVMAGDGNLVISSGSFSHEVKVTGKLFNSTWVQLCVIEDEKIKEYRFYEDSAAFVAASIL